ncbi:hypothetical protein VNI00_008890 [Paramarasmius palmivorus]|uniref:Uncharacterized protein n=1 Tax=Paramarasmius palmivorus TaxID=297713 RepID=A0AAW0CRM0_9AGAR
MATFLNLMFKHLSSVIPSPELNVYTVPPISMQVPPSNSPLVFGMLWPSGNIDYGYKDMKFKGGGKMYTIPVYRPYDPSKGCYLYPFSIQVPHDIGAAVLDLLIHAVDELENIRDVQVAIEKYRQHKVFEMGCDLMEKRYGEFYAIHVANEAALFCDRDSAQKLWDASERVYDRRMTVHHTFSAGFFAMLTQGQDPLYDFVTENSFPDTDSPRTLTPSLAPTPSVIGRKLPVKSSQHVGGTSSYREKDTESDEEFWSNMSPITSQDCDELSEIERRTPKTLLSPKQKKPHFPSVDTSLFPAPILTPKKKASTSPSRDHQRRNTPTISSIIQTPVRGRGAGVVAVKPRFDNLATGYFPAHGYDEQASQWIQDLFTQVRGQQRVFLTDLEAYTKPIPSGEMEFIWKILDACQYTPSVAGRGASIQPQNGHRGTLGLAYFKNHDYNDSVADTIWALFSASGKNPQTFASRVKADFSGIPDPEIDYMWALLLSGR